MRFIRIFFGVLILTATFVLSVVAQPCAIVVEIAPKVVAPAPPANLIADVSADIVRLYVDKPIDRTKPVVDCILGTRIRGTGCTKAQATAELIPCDELAAVDIVVVGRTWTKTVGVNKSVTLCNDGIVDFTVRTRLSIDGNGIRNETPVAMARVQTFLTGLSADVPHVVNPLVRRVARRQYDKNKPEAIAISEDHARTQLVDDTLTDLVPE